MKSQRSTHSISKHSLYPTSPKVSHSGRKFWTWQGYKRRRDNNDEKGQVTGEPLGLSGYIPQSHCFKGNTCSGQRQSSRLAYFSAGISETLQPLCAL